MVTWSLRVWICLLLTAGPLTMAASGRPLESADRAGAFEVGWASAADQDEVLARLIEQSHPLRATGATEAQRQRLNGVKAPPALQAVAIMVEFADTCFYGRQDYFPGPLPTSTQSSFYYPAHDSLYYAHLLRDVADYFEAVSGDRFVLQVTVHGRVVELPAGMAHYGNHPDAGEQPFLLAAEAIADLDAEVDFSGYDTVILIHAGAGQETDILKNSPEQIQSTYLGPDAFAWAVEDSTLAEPFIWTGDFPAGQGVRHVLILPENQFQDPYEGFSGHFGSLGTYCFVVGLRLGMLSLSDFTPAGAPDSQGVGQFCLMGYGLFAAGGYIPPQPCAFNKMLMGWLDPYPVDPDLGATWTLVPSVFAAHPQAAARIDLTGAEYYLLEYRLQDPDGNGIFSFAGDLNGNNVPDFYDSRNPAGGYVPVNFFDSATCQREWLTGAEWDFFMSDNSARPPGVKGAGSGICIWHIDEGVIRDAFGQRRNLFNADPRRKSVDLVEADGIQDLDSRQPSPYWLGGDDDSFRGENNAVFGTDTRPATLTNGGVRTGLVIDEISNVVVDSAHVYYAGTDSAYTGILYAEAMTFRCRREETGQSTVIPLAARDLPGVDMTGSHLLVAPLGGDLAAGPPVFVAAADSGRLYAWTSDLGEWIDHDADAETFWPLATGTDESGQPVAWLPPAAAGQFATDVEGLEIVLASSAGLYAFHQDGTPVMSGPGETARGRVAADQILLPPVLVPLEPPGDLASTVVACVVVPGPEPEAIANRLRFIDRHGEDYAPAVDLPGLVTASPVHLDGILVTPLKTAGGGALAAIQFGAQTSLLWQVPLAIVPGGHPPLVAASAAGSADRAALAASLPVIDRGPTVIMVTDADGRGQTVVLTGEGAQVQPPWPEDLIAAGPLGPGGAFTGEGLLGRVAASGAAWTGWPRRPVPAIRASGTQPLGLVAGRGDGLWVDQLFHLFATGDGRLYLTGPQGEIQPGWPLAGPADLLAAPAIVALDEGGVDERLLLMAAGTSPAITGIAGVEGGERPSLMTRAVTRLRSWGWPNVGLPLQVPATGVMSGGTAWRGGAVGSLTGPVVGSFSSLAASHVCYPQPLTADRLRVRGMISYAARARAVILNLQGQQVRDTGEVAVLANTPFELEIDMLNVAAGLYLCRLEAGGQTSVRTIAVTR